MQNSAVAAVFEELGDLLEIQGANAFRVRAYRQAARVVGDLAEPLTAFVDTPGRALTDLDGIGEDLAKKIIALVQTGHLAQLDELRLAIPSGVRDMMRVQGLGPKKAAALFEQLQVQSLAQLRQAAEQGLIAPLKGFGKKTQEGILKALDQVSETAAVRVYLADALPQAQAIVDVLAAVPGVQQIEAAGSLRRRKETIGDVDILATAADSGPVMDRLAADPRVASILARGDTKLSVRLTSGLQMDLRVVPEESFGAALQYFTGSKEHNIVVRRRAIERGLKVNEYGVFRDDVSLAGRTEEEVYAAIGLPWIPPELREDRGEFELADAGRLPKLIEAGDIRGDLHIHTTATDGTASIRDMAEAAQARGLQYIAITDHSKRVTMANGLDADRLRAHWAEIDKVRKQVKGIEILRGIECDILENAALDLPDDVLAEADWVIAVLHYGLNQPGDQIMERLLHAIRNPHVDIIGHPTGRLIGRRPPADINFEVFLQAAADHGVMLEINAHRARLDLNDVHAAAAKAKQIPIVISTDAHGVNGFSELTYGIYQARRAGLTAADVANTLPFPEFQKRIRRSL